MAYALSAAMAVTVVPTYMMKPLVVEAAVNPAKDNNSLISGDSVTLAAGAPDTEYYYKISTTNSGDLETTDSTVTSDANSKITINIPESTTAATYYVLYATKANVEAGTKTGNPTADFTVIDHRVTISTSLKEGTTYTITDETNTGTTPYTTVAFFAGGTTFTSGGSTTLSNALYSTTFTSGQPTTIDYTNLPVGDYEVVVTSAAASDTLDSTSNCETVGVAIEAADAGSITNGTVSKSSFKYGDKISYTLNDTITNGKYTIGLFPTSVALGATPNKDKAAYLFDSSSEAVQMSRLTPNSKTVSFYIPDDVAEGSYYVAAIADKEIDDLQSASFETIAASNLIEVKADSIATGISLEGTNSTISYKDGSVSNVEALSTSLKGGTKYSKVEYYVTEGGTGFEINDVAATSNTTTPFKVVTDSASLSDLKVNVDPSSVADNAKMTITAKMYVAGRKNPYTRSYTFTAKSDLVTATATKVSADKEYILGGEEVTITSAVTPAASNEKIEYKLVGNVVGGGVSLKEAVKGTVHYSYYDKDNDEEYKEGTDELYATFDETTGILSTKKAGEYTVEARTSGVQSATTGMGSTTVKAIGLKLDVNGMVVGKSNQAAANQLTISGVTAPDAYVTYTVEDTDIVKVANATAAVGAGMKVDTLKEGLTAIKANVLIYGEKETYTFDTTGYFAVAPKLDDKEFELTSIPDTEVYFNTLAKAAPALISTNVKEQAFQAILDDAIDASVLSFTSYDLINRGVVNSYTGYYDITDVATLHGTNTQTATGLLFAVADPDLIAGEEPDDSSTVEYVVSDLQEKDKVYKQKNSIINYVAELTVDGKVVEPQKPVWITVNDAKLADGHTYTVYDNGEAIFTAKAVGTTLTFQTDSFSVFSIVETPGATVTDNTAKLPDDNPDSEDIYDKVNFSAHVQRRIGTDDEADIAATVSDDGIISLGTHGQSRRVEKFTLNGLDADSVEMTAHVQKRVDHPEDVADLTQVVNEDGSISIGTEHQSRRIEAFSMNLKGDLAEKYDVYYRVHAQNYGWLGWAKNGEIAGTSGHSFRLEGIEIIFVEKGTEFDESQYVKTPEEGDRGYSEKAAYMDRVVSEK